MKRILLVLSMLAIGLWGYAQSVELSATGLPATTLKNNAGDEYGKGSMQKYKARISAPFYYRKTAWGASTCGRSRPPEAWECSATAARPTA